MLHLPQSISVKKKRLIMITWSHAFLICFRCYFPPNPCPEDMLGHWWLKMNNYTASSWPIWWEKHVWRSTTFPQWGCVLYHPPCQARHKKLHNEAIEIWDTIDPIWRNFMRKYGPVKEGQSCAFGGNTAVIKKSVLADIVFLPLRISFCKDKQSSHKKG